MTDAVTPIVLTAEQQAIVDHPLLPLRVSAGAGTGKTTTIVERLAHVIENGLEPERTLGITFTNKAAEELADRLRTRLPQLSAEGREVEVTTYHGFAYRILNEFGVFVGIERGLDIVGPGYVRQLLHESVGDEPFDHLDLTGLPWRIDEAASLGGQLAGNLREPEDIEDAAPENAAEDQKVWGPRLELMGILSRYRTLKEQLGVVDYGDLIRLAHRLLSTNTHIRDRIRSRYSLVMLDEYQDTDPGQRELLRCLFGDGFPLTAVGDEDQTIYEWRGASPLNFRRFDGHFPEPDGDPAATLRLTVNRRSGPAVLAIANEIRHVLHGAPPIDRLRPPGDAVIDDAVSCAWFRTAWEEATWIADEMRRLHDEENTEWRDMAVLFRKNRQIALVRDALHEADIPLEVASLGGLLSVPEVADVHAWLSILGRPDDSVALARILLGARYRLGLGDIAPLSTWMKTQNRTTDLSAEDTYPLLEAIDRLPAVAGLSDTARQRLSEFRDLYRRLLADAQGVTLIELVRRIIDGIDGWAEVEAMPEVAGLSARLNLYRFLDLIEDWSPLAGRPSLEGFLGYLDVLADERSSDELDTARVGDENAVSLLTVHRAKGLEWNTVFLPALAAGTFPAGSQGFDDPLSRAKHLPYELRIDADMLPVLPEKEADRRDILRESHIAQERRTAYVAVTRAQRRLIATGAHWYGGTTRPKKPGELIELIRAADSSDVTHWDDDPGEAPADHRMPNEAPDPHFREGWRGALQETLTDPRWMEQRTVDMPGFHGATKELQMTLDGMPDPPDPATIATDPTTSVTGLVTLASCPQRFYWNEIDRLPRRPSPWLQHGTEIHRRIELHHRGVLTLADAVPDAPDIAEEPPARDESATGQTMGHPDAFATFLDSRFAGQDPVLVETPIDLTVDGVRVRGRIDAVYEVEPGRWEIVDYKSGRPSTDPAAIVQLEAYAVAAMDGAMAGGRPERVVVTFAYLGGGELVERSYEVDDQWLDDARRRLAALASRVKGDEFVATPSPACRRCDFTRFCPAGTAWLADDRAP